MENTQERKLDGRTLIFDSKEQQQVLWLDGVVVPVGSVVQLGEPNRDAKVIGIRLWASEPATVILDCEITDISKTQGTDPTPKPRLRLV